jgi:RNA polymerase sigma-70 factor (ECF subfamily)
MDNMELTPEQRSFAEEHHGLLLAFMARYRLDQDFYDVLALRYLKTVMRYHSDPLLQRYAFSTILWKHLRSELSHELKRAYRNPVEIVFDDQYCPSPPSEPYLDQELWKMIENTLTRKQAEVILLRNSGYTNREIGALCGISRKAVEKRFHRIRIKLKKWRIL